MELRDAVVAGLVNVYTLLPTHGPVGLKEKSWKNGNKVSGE